ncbi:type II/IV secretion system protein [bacterium]|nr:type II/IV secretion system protein [bacterium]
MQELPLSAEQLQALAHDEDPCERLIEKNWCSAEEILRVESVYYQCPSLSLRRYQPDLNVVRLLTEQQARRVRAIPLFRVDDHLYLATSDPENLQAQDFVAQLTGLVVEPVVALASEIDEALTRFLLSSEQSNQTLNAITAAVKEDKGLQQKTEVLENREIPTVKLVDHLITQSIRLGSSDLHIEPFADKVLLRYRIDGHLREFAGPPRAIYEAIVSRIKISSGLDIAERRIPQDGRASILVDEKKYDLRVSVIPNLHGEGIVMRILNPHAVQMDLKSLGFEPELLKRYELILTRPHGVVLVTGPTGSGKSTTLYATLNKIMDLSKKIITLEDPVEYQLPNVTQIQVQPEIGYTFAQGLRAVLRHDPDVVLVGEIRDLESAQIAIRAALTGHQMFSTLHTNDAPQAITRLMDMGIPLYQLQAALNGVLAQRLVRKLCKSCRELAPPSQQMLQALGIASDEVPIFRAQGCKECNGSGYKGRVAVHELLDFSPALRRVPEAQAQEIPSIAAAEGSFFPIRDSLASKVAKGMTSVQEALNLLSLEG